MSGDERLQSGNILTTKLAQRRKDRGDAFVLNQSRVTYGFERDVFLRPEIDFTVASLESMSANDC